MMNLPIIKPTHKSGNEAFHQNGKPTSTTVNDFWAWSSSDLLSNALRGVLAEFIVGTAIGLKKKSVRDEWADVDLTTKDGIKIEVKSSAYLQSWAQNGLSKISFSIKPTKSLNLDTNQYSETSKRQADVYVFCLLHHQDPKTVDPLNLDQWEFYVVSTKLLNTTYPTQKTMALSTLKKISVPISYSHLKQKVRETYDANSL